MLRGVKKNYPKLVNKAKILLHTVVKNLPASARDMGSSLGQGRSHMPWSN